MNEKKDLKIMVAKADALMAAPLNIYLEKQKQTVQAARLEIEEMTKRCFEAGKKSQAAKEKEVCDSVRRAFKDLGWEEK
ncbi:MAG: hypothetical protein PUI76_02645 [Mollicutes bacterium]|nr:hypothetical protein [Mollicutes bacterium]MDD7064163.1 hypothetical protein [Mollicutes bacterium]MDY2686787.1 hypothetical protein [Candidatus Enteromonas sp.]MDY5298502.1 hypothetical protein [Candidatus Enteromonas sp.]